MNNIELENKIKELIQIDNYFDFVLAVRDFEKDYKTSDFYKKTRKPLAEVMKESRIYYALQLKDINNRLQNLLDNLSLDNLNDLLDKMGDTFSRENLEIKENLEVFKDLKG